jgi:hypothetical protein
MIQVRPDSTMFITGSVLDQLRKIDKKQIAVAQLEALGLPLRIINMLEQYLGVIWLDELLQYTPDDLKENVPNLGDKGIALILDTVRRFDDVEQANEAAARRLHNRQLASDVKRQRNEKKTKRSPK